jgi:hypothetical protein
MSLFNTSGGGLNPSYLLTQLSKGTSAYGYLVIDSLLSTPGTIKSATSTTIFSPVPIGYDGYQTLGTGVRIAINNLGGSFISGNDTDRAITILH